MKFADIHQLLCSHFGDAIVRAETNDVDPWIEVAAGDLVEVCRFLRDEPALRFNMLNLISGVDYFETEERKQAVAKTAGKKDALPSWPPHIEVLYHLSSLVHKHRLVLMVSLPRWKEDVPGQLPELASVSGVWATANWHEREVYDLIGVHFVGHPDLTRILLPDDWIGYPLRKDYRPPHEYHGIARRISIAAQPGSQGEH